MSCVISTQEAGLERLMWRTLCLQHVVEGSSESLASVTRGCVHRSEF